ncbi:ABC transporter permease [Leucobacter sp. W1478]|uniref:ABC transporter permease n=1 Tax=Leucobacter sp. W1478 TaxID=3439065 RepID=UPI003F3ADA39
MERSDRLVAERSAVTARWLGRFGWAIAVALPLGFLALFFVWPVLALVATGLFDSGSPGSSAPSQVFAEPRTWRVIGQTLTQAVLGTALSVLLGLPAAFVLYRLQFRGQSLLRGLATVPFVLPTVVVGVAFTALLGPGAPLHWLGLDQSLTAIVLALAFFNVTVVLRTVGGFWAQLDPRSEEAARMLGAGPVRVFLTITLPNLGPAIASAAALVFLFCATSFGVVLILGGRQFSNIETEIYRLTVQFLDLRSAAVLSLVQFAIVIVVLLLSARLRKSRDRAVALRYIARGAQRPTRAHVPAIAVFAVTALGLHALPILALVWRSLRGADGALSLENYVHLVVPPEGSRLNGSVLDAIWLSLQTAMAATAIAMFLGVLTALVASRQPSNPHLGLATRTFDGFVMLPLGVSAVTLGFGLLLTMHRPLGVGFDLRTSVVLIPIAQALIALPLVVRTLLPVLRGIDPRLREAAATLGASPLRILATIDLAMLGRSAGLALGFAFATSLGEFGATAFLVRPGDQTLPVVIAQLIGQQGAENYGMALASAVVLGALTAGVMLVAERWRGDVAGEW